VHQNTNCLLILDDDVAVAQTIGFVAEGLGFRVHCFDMPAPFLNAVRTLSPSHLVLDLVMPAMDGVSVLQRLAQSSCRAGLILTSGTGPQALESAQAVAAGLGLHVVGVLPKPFRPKLLRELLRTPPRPPNTG
jgi:FixJ family two-component response regulator